MGSVRRRGPSWLLDYYDMRGRRYRETIQAATKQEAERVLKQREGEIAIGRPSAFLAEKVTFNELAENFLREYEINGRRSLGRAKISIAHLKAFFDGYKAVNISTVQVENYVQKRQRMGASNGTINRELAALKRMFKLAVQAGTLLRAPHVPMLTESPPRSGFFEQEQSEAVLRHLPPEIKPIALFAYETGWRLREITGLQWRQVDLKEGGARLDAQMSKNKQPRLIYLSAGLLEILKAQAEATRALEQGPSRR